MVKFQLVKTGAHTAIAFRLGANGLILNLKQKLPPGLDESPVLRKDIFLRGEYRGDQSGASTYHALQI